MFDNDEIREIGTDWCDKKILDIRVPKGKLDMLDKNEIDLITDCPITELTALDFIAIMYKKPIASKDFINKIILDLKKTK